MKAENILFLLMFRIIHGSNYKKEQTRPNCKPVPSEKQYFSDISEKRAEAIHKRDLCSKEVQSTQNLLRSEFDRKRIARQTNSSIDITKVVNDINNLDIDGATDNFRIQTAESKKALAEVIKRAYTVENEDRILDFGRSLKWLLDRAIVYKVFYEELQKNNRLNSPIVLELQYQGDKDYKWFKSLTQTYTDTPEIKQLLGDLAESVKKPVEDVLRNWGEQVRDAQFEEIKQFAKSHSNAFGEVIKDLVKNAYRHNDDSASKLIDLSNELFLINEIGKLVLALYKEMQPTKSDRFSPILRIASKLKIIFGWENYKNVDDSLKQRLSELWESFPDDVRAVASGDPVYLKNDGFPIWYYLVVKSHYDEDRDTVLAVKYKDQNILSYLWRIEPSQDGRQVTIKSEPTHNYMYAAGDFFAFNEKERRVFTWNKKELVYQGYWELRSHDWENSKYYLYNTHHKEYLNVRMNGTESSDVLSTTENFEKSEARVVYSWRMGGKGDKAVWTIQLKNTNGPQVNQNLTDNQNLLNECVTKIVQGDYKTASSMLQRLGIGQTSDVIKRTYSDTNSTQIMNLIAELPWLENDPPLLTATACMTLMVEMQIKNDLDNSDIFLMQKYTDFLALTGSTKQISDNITGMIKKSEPYVLNKWAWLIINNTHEEIIWFIEKHHEIFYDYSDLLLKRIYDISQEKVQHILNFVYDITVAKIAVKLLTDLADYIVQTSKEETLPFTLQMAHRIREVMSLPNYNQVEIDLINKMERMWENQLWHIKLLIRNSPVCMKNEAKNGSYFLYAKNHMDEHRDRVMATADVAEHKVSIKWVFETLDRTKTFLIKSHETNDYLYAAADFFAISDDKRRVLSWRGGERVQQGVWQLHAQADVWKENKFLLYNTHYRQYLNVIEDYSSLQSHLTDFDRNNAFTWRKDGYGPNPLWTFVEC